MTVQFTRIGIGLGTLAGVLTLSEYAFAQTTVPCDTLPAPIVYAAGGSATKPVIGVISAEFWAAVGAERLTLVYQSASGACAGFAPLIQPEGQQVITGTASFWEKDATGKIIEKTCSLPVAGARIDFANMGNSALLCQGVEALPPGIGDFLGPALGVNVFVDKASTQQAISTEALAYIYGRGTDGVTGVSPWLNAASIVRRNDKSFVQLFIAKATGVPAASFVGFDAGTNQGSVDKVVEFAAANGPETAIGFASSEVADKNRAKVRTLAHQHTGQTCGYWPDSTADSFDKANVRSGQYFLWSNVHFFARVDAKNTIVDPNVGRIIGIFTGTVAPPGAVDALATYATNSLVPDCAMRVQRTGDLGPLASYAPSVPCGCYWESKATGKAACSPCTTDVDCPTAGQKCRYGYCEAY
jgi:hypothetical protein